VKEPETGSRGHPVSFFDKHDLIPLAELLVPAPHEFFFRLDVRPELSKRRPALSDIGLAFRNVNVTHFFTTLSVRNRARRMV
jgi:hypothetical protein